MTPSNATTIGGQIGGLIRLMRPKQWVKNAFVLAPLIFARAFNDPTAVTEALIAVALFCAASSASYIVNDLHDREADRAHPTKRRSRSCRLPQVSRPSRERKTLRTNAKRRSRSRRRSEVECCVGDPHWIAPAKPGRAASPVSRGLVLGVIRRCAVLARMEH